MASGDERKSSLANDHYGVGDTQPQEAAGSNTVTLAGRPQFETRRPQQQWAATTAAATGVGQGPKFRPAPLPFGLASQLYHQRNLFEQLVLPAAAMAAAAAASAALRVSAAELTAQQREQHRHLRRPGGESDPSNDNNNNGGKRAVAGDGVRKRRRRRRHRCRRHKRQQPQVGPKLLRSAGEPAENSNSTMPDGGIKEAEPQELGTSASSSPTPPSEAAEEPLRAVTQSADFQATGEGGENKSFMEYAPVPINKAT